MTIMFCREQHCLKTEIEITDSHAATKVDVPVLSGVPQGGPALVRGLRDRILSVFGGHGGKLSIFQNDAVQM